MKILVDTNILIDVAQQREPHLVDSDRVLKWCEAHPGSAFIAWHSISNLYYVLRKPLGDAATRQFIAVMLDFLEVAATGTASAKHALALPMGDFEDAMQCAAAVHAGVDYVVTRDMGDYSGSVVPAIRPADFLSQAPV
jgi:predicted nucleic acid-binding protein